MLQKFEMERRKGQIFKQELDKREGKVFGV
jgi:hypothetical protein